MDKAYPQDKNLKCHMHFNRLSLSCTISQQKIHTCFLLEIAYPVDKVKTRRLQFIFLRMLRGRFIHVGKMYLETEPMYPRC